MAEPDIRQFSPNALREIQRDHTRLKSLVTNLTRRQRVYDSLDSEPIRTITGITSTSTSFPTYPTSGNTYVVKLNDYYFTEATGTNSRTSAGTSSQYVIARTWDGLPIPENTPVMCDMLPCHGKGYRWWIRPGSSMRKARASSTIYDGGSGSAEIWQAGAASGVTVTVHYDWMTGGGDIASGTDLLIYYFADEQHWSVIAAECA